MANPHRGEELLKVGNQSYTLALGINSLCALEAHLNRPIFKVILDLEVMGRNPIETKLGLVRSVLWATLQDHHPGLDIDAAGELLGEAGIEQVMRAVMIAVTAAMPIISPAAAKKGKAARPPKAGS